MAKIIFSVLVCFSVLAQSFNQTIIVFDFNMHQREIAQSICENKNKPMMHCNGHCQLKKRLDQQEQKEQSTPPGSIKDKTELVYFSESTSEYVFFLPGVNNTYFSPAGSTTVDFAGSIFHPPSC